MSRRQPACRKRVANGRSKRADLSPTPSKRRRAEAFASALKGVLGESPRGGAEAHRLEPSGYTAFGFVTREFVPLGFRLSGFMAPEHLDPVRDACPF